MKKIFLMLLILLNFAAYSQTGYRATRQNGATGSTQDYVVNSPGNTAANSYLLVDYKDSTNIAFFYKNIRFGIYNSSKNDGVPTTILWVDANGNLKKSPIPSWLTVETDPIWNSEKANYYTKSLSDARYLQSFTEIDPIWNSEKVNYYTKVASDARYLQSFIETDPIWTAVSSNYRTKLQNDGLYYPISGNPSGFLTSFTELDPTVPAYAKTLSSFTTIKASTDALYRPITYVPAFTDITGLPTTLAGYGITNGVATSRTLTIAGTTLDLSANRTWTPTTTDISEGVNLYYNNSRARNAISLSTIGSGAATYDNSTGVLNIPTPITYTAGTGISISTGVVTNTAPDQTVSLTGANGLAVTGTYPNFTITQYIPTITNNVTRPINSTTFTVSSTKQAFVSYNVSISCTATIGSAASGSVALQYSTNAGSTWNTVGTVSNSNTVTLAIVLNSVQISGQQVSGFIPANALVRMVSTTAGTTTITYNTGQETY